MSARGMMMAVGCIQAKHCHLNNCPTGVATQNPWLTRGLDVEDKSKRVEAYHRNTLKSALRMLGSMGLHDVSQIGPAHVIRRVDQTEAASYEDIYTWLERESLLNGTAPDNWQRDYDRAQPTAYTNLPSISASDTTRVRLPGHHLRAHRNAQGEK